MPAFVRGGESADAANSGAAGPRSDADTRGSGSDGGALWVRSWSPSSAATPRAACTLISRPSCCSTPRPARCWRCSTAVTSPRRARRRCPRSRRAFSRARRRRRSPSSAAGVQARSHLEALSRVHTLRQVAVWSPNKQHRDQFVEEANTAQGSDGGQTGVRPAPDASGGRTGVRPQVRAVDHAGEAVVGADVIVLVTSSPTPVLESGWVKPGAHVISVGACRPNQREMDPALVARARLLRRLARRGAGRIGRSW